MAKFWYPKMNFSTFSLLSKISRFLGLRAIFFLTENVLIGGKPNLGSLLRVSCRDPIDLKRTCHLNCRYLNSLWKFNVKERDGSRFVRMVRLCDGIVEFGRRHVVWECAWLRRSTLHVQIRQQREQLLISKS